MKNTKPLPGQVDKMTTVERGIYVLPNSKFYWIRYGNGHGGMIRETTKTDSIMEARKILRIKQADIAKGKQPFQYDKVTLSEIFKDHMTDLRLNNRKCLNQTDAYHKKFIDFFGDCPVKSLTKPKIDRYIQHRKDANIKNASINVEVATLRRALLLGQQNDKVYKVPRIQMLDETDSIREEYFEYNEYERLLDGLKQVDADYLVPPVILSFYSGWRVQEVLGLKWDKVDLINGIIHLERARSKNKQPRIFVLKENPELYDIFKILYHNKPNDCSYVFHNNGQRIKSHYYVWHKALEKAGLTNKRWHDFRRSFITHSRRLGIPDNVIQMITGHKSNEVFQRYSILKQPDIENAISQYANAMRQRKDILTTHSSQKKKDKKQESLTIFDFIQEEEAKQQIK